MANAQIGGAAAQQPNSADAVDPAHHKSLDGAAHPPQKLSVLTLGALGVVYGDIGTSPIYAFREALRGRPAASIASRDDMLGVLSLIVWALTHHRYGQIRPLRPARRQQRRGRHAVADGAGPQRAFPSARCGI